MSDARPDSGFRILWRHLRAPALAALVVGLASLQAAWVIRQRDDDAIRAWSVARAREASVAIHARLQLFELAFDRMVRRQEFAPDPEAWRADADEQLETFPALVGIAWIGEDHGVRAATHPRVAAWCRPPDDEAFRTALTRQVEAGRLYFTKAESDAGVLMCAYDPLVGDGSQGDYFIAAARVATTFENYLPGLDPGVRIRAHLGGTTVYDRVGDDRHAFSRFVGEDGFRVGPFAVAIAAGPSSELLARLRSPAPWVVLLVGQGIAALVGYAVWSTGQARRRAQRLTEEVDQRAAAEERTDRRAAELEIARDAARSASRAKSEFLANMSHEIRTPLNAVIGLTEALLRTDVDERQRDHLETVMISSESLLGVLNDVLDFSKIEAGRLELERVRFELHDAVGDTLKSFAMMAERKGLELACFIAPDVPPTLVGDPARLRQVLTNLLSNAIKFTDRGEIVVRVELEERNDAALLLFEVRDTGVGVPPGQLDRLFESFEQADPSTTRRHGGSGLGLTICRELVSLMDGAIGAESTPGLGSTFHFTARFGVVEGVVARRIGRVALDGRRVLVVDDNPTNRAILEELTQAVAMRPVVAESAELALRALNSAVEVHDPFEVLVADVHMPEIDGYGLVERIRADPVFDDLAILLLTSAGAEGDQARSERLRVAARLVKPVKQLELFEVMARALARADAGETLRAPIPTRFEEREIALPPLRILLAEDSLANQKVAIAMLHGFGHEITTAQNGRRAVDLAASRDFDVVLMDIEMPIMDGLEAAQAIRDAERGTDRHLPIAALTAHAMQGAREKCLRAGMDDYIAKPMRRTRLLEVIAKLAGDAGAEGVVETPVLFEAGTPRAVDWSALLDQVGGRPEALQGIVEAYVSEIRESLSQLDRFLPAGDAKRSRLHAHILVGAMRTFGATEAVALASEIERSAESGETARVAPALPQLRVSAERVLPELEHFLRTGRVPE